MNCLAVIKMHLKTVLKFTRKVYIWFILFSSFIPICYDYLHAGTDKNKSLFNQLNKFNLNKKLKGTKIDYNSSFEMSYWKHAYLI